jgi:DHA2 family multidrug resistance protein
MLSLGVGALQMMLDRGEQLDWFGSTEILVEAALSALGFYLFLVHIFTADEPFIDPKMFRDRNLSVGLSFIFVVGIILLGSLALMTPFLQNLMDYPVVTAGLVLAPRGVGTMLAMLIVGRLIARIDTRLLILFGFGLVAFSLWEMTGFNTDVSQALLVRTGFVQGLGLGFIFVPLSTITFSTLPPELRTQATALFSLMRNLGSSIGISVVIWLLTRNTQVMHANLVEHATPFDPFFRWPAVGQMWGLDTMTGRAALDAEITRQATTISYLNDFKLMMVVALAAIPLLLVMRKPTRAAPTEAAVMD